LLSEICILITVISPLVLEFSCSISSFDENKSFYGEQTEKRPAKKKIISRGIN
jgi:hypothetical protein